MYIYVHWCLIVSSIFVIILRSKLIKDNNSVDNKEVISRYSVQDVHVAKVS